MPWYVLCLKYMTTACLPKSLLKTTPFKLRQQLFGLTSPSRHSHDQACRRAKSHSGRYPRQAQHAIAEAAISSSARTSDANVNAAEPNNNASSIAAARVVLEALAVARAGIVGMREALSRMPVGCHPLIFYHRVRPFLSGWKANPTLPDGVLYEVLCAWLCVSNG